MQAGIRCKCGGSILQMGDGDWRCVQCGRELHIAPHPDAHKPVRNGVKDDVRNAA